jgi:hypothetical protein
MQLNHQLGGIGSPQKTRMRPDVGLIGDRNLIRSVGFYGLKLLEWSNIEYHGTILTDRRAALRRVQPVRVSIAPPEGMKKPAAASRAG